MPEEPNANATSPAPVAESENTSPVGPATGGTAAATDPNAVSTTKLEPADLTSFLSLRDSIHVFEWAALKFYMSAPTVEAREAKAATVAQFVKDFKDKVGLPEGCPPGFTATANGRCVSNG